ncbi:hypothetical protein Tco_1502376 [Tanacetum coccineum]
MTAKQTGTHLNPGIPKTNIPSTSLNECMFPNRHWRQENQVLVKASTSISLETLVLSSSCTDMDLVRGHPKLKFGKGSLMTRTKSSFFNTIRKQPSRSDWDLLFQPMFDESLNPPTYVDLQAPKVIAPIPEAVAPWNLAYTHDIEVAHMGNDPYFGSPIPEVPSDQSSSSVVIHTIVPPDHQVSEHNSKWTKDHPLENIIGALDRPVSTRLQLHEHALFCYYDAFLTSVEPKNYKEALTHVRNKEMFYL